ncbi:hypothetical protein Taro_011596 [Colocasia esculenta]|uniref:Uncharacterized protein n=1 Tax=Colocasia esculenta TaxID=4460 RepID=A0A843UGK0_COLES|nr:hypothetical protein [Colocasia esculenta]
MRSLWMAQGDTAVHLFAAHIGIMLMQSPSEQNSVSGAKLQDRTSTPYVSLHSLPRNSAERAPLSSSPTAHRLLHLQLQPDDQMEVETVKWVAMENGMGPMEKDQLVVEPMEILVEAVEKDQSAVGAVEIEVENGREPLQKDQPAVQAFAQLTSSTLEVAPVVS